MTEVTPDSLKTVSFQLFDLKLCYEQLPKRRRFFLIESLFVWQMNAKYIPAINSLQVVKNTVWCVDPAIIKMVYLTNQTAEALLPLRK